MADAKISALTAGTPLSTDILPYTDLIAGTTKKTTVASIGSALNLSGTNTGDQDLSGLVTKTTTVNGHALSSNVTVTASDVGADPTGTAAAAIVTHVALPDPHTQYQKGSEKDAAGGYAGLDGSTKLNASQLPSSVTTQGNVFNSSLELVQLDAFGRLPAIDGSQLINLPASGHTIQDNGVSVTQRGRLNFLGTGVSLSDNPANNSTDVTISGGGGSAANYQQVFTGDGLTASYALSVAPANAKAIVTLNGNQAEPTTDYTISGVTLTFGANVPSGWKIVVSYSGASTSATEFTQIAVPYRSVTGTATLLAADSVVICSGAGPYAVTLPAANANTPAATIINVKNITGSDLTINRAGADLVETATSIVVADEDSVTLASDGTSNWYVI